MFIETSSQGFFAVLRPGIRRQRETPHEGVFAAGRPDAPDELVTRHARHPDAADDQVGLELPNQLQSIFA
jgi:hypothetical protein